MSKRRLAGQRALVTGASSGIGAEIARRLAAEGAHLVLTARRKDRLEALAAELQQAHGVQVQVEANDLAEPGAAKALFDATEGAGHAVDVLVNNAGFGQYEHFTEIAWERHASMIQVNVTALTELMHRFLPAMQSRRHGWVMNVASIGAYMPTPNFAAYTASKAYVRNLSEAVDYELRGSGVRVISVCPGGTRTEFLDQADQKLKSAGEAFMMSAERCADIAVRKMLAGRRNVVTGFMNALGMWLIRFVPRSWMPGIAGRAMSAGVDKVKALPPPAPPAV